MGQRSRSVAIGAATPARVGSRLALVLALTNLTTLATFTTLTIGLAACGQRGPLKLPQAAAAAASSPAASAP